MAHQLAKKIFTSVLSVTALASCNTTLPPSGIGSNAEFNTIESEDSLSLSETPSGDFTILSSPYRGYNASKAAEYAKNNYNTPYGGSSGNPFPNYDGTGLAGGNCTNFVSQAIMAGLLNTNSMKTTYDNRKEFNADSDPRYKSSTQWYFFGKDDRGSAWAGANNLYSYAKSNKSTYKGLHFQYVTNDSAKAYLNYDAVKVGDVVFADWTGDGWIDHTMIVTQKHDGDWWSRIGYSGYNRIRITYQTNNKTDVGLGDLNEQNGKKALFYIYRPTDYNPKGL